VLGTTELTESKLIKTGASCAVKLQKKMILSRLLWVGLKIEIDEIHQNLQNPLTINRNPPSAMKSTSTEQKIIIEIQVQRNLRHPLTNQQNPSAGLPDWAKQKCANCMAYS